MGAWSSPQTVDLRACKLVTRRRCRSELCLRKSAAASDLPEAQHLASFRSEGWFVFSGPALGLRCVDEVPRPVHDSSFDVADFFCSILPTPFVAARSSDTHGGRGDASLSLYSSMWDLNDFREGFSCSWPQRHNNPTLRNTSSWRACTPAQGEV